VLEEKEKITTPSDKKKAPAFRRRLSFPLSSSLAALAGLEGVSYLLGV